MKVCHVITRMIVGGAQENTLLSAKGLAAAGHECVLLTGPSPGPEGELLARTGIPEGVEVVMRERDGRRFLFVLNFQKEPQQITLHSDAVLLYTGETKRGTIVMSPFETAVYELI